MGELGPVHGFTISMTVEDAVSVGLDFGLDAAGFERWAVERALLQRLSVIATIMGETEDAETAVAAFDREAWEAFEGSGKWRYLGLAKTA